MTPFRSPHILFPPSARRIALLTLSIPAIYATKAMSTTAPITSQNSSSTTTPFPTRAYTPTHPTFPYNPRDFLRADETADTDFYAQPRFVNHIDDHAIGLLGEYYKGVLPRRGRVLDFCSSWVSHFPKEVVEGVVKRSGGGGGGDKEVNGKVDEKGDGTMDGKGNGKEEGVGLEVIGLGMNEKELHANPILSTHILQDLNTNPTIPPQVGTLDASVCVVSIDYLTKPVEVLSSLRESTRRGGSVHLVISNRCFPTKVVGRWLRIGEQERLEMVGDYLWWSGWRGVEIVEVCDGGGKGWFGGGVDPLWVVRGVKVEDGKEGGELERSEL